MLVNFGDVGVGSDTSHQRQCMHEVTLEEKGKRDVSNNQGV